MNTTVFERVMEYGELPYQPSGSRVLVQIYPMNDKTQGGIVIPDSAKTNQFAGRILAGGLDALDKMIENDQRIGDDVLFAKFAGVVEELDHVVVKGNKDKCKHEWSRMDGGHNGRPAHKCKCGAIRQMDGTVVLLIDDIILNVTQANRLRTGEVYIYLGVTADGKPQHVFKRKE